MFIRNGRTKMTFDLLSLVNEYTSINVEYNVVPSPKLGLIFSIQREGIS